MNLILLVSSLLAFACQDSVEREQYVRVMGPGDQFWQPVPGEIHEVSLANGERIGVEISPVDADFYLERMGDRAAYLETVSISIYELHRDPPERLTTTYADSNSIQGYSAQGGADAIPALGDQSLRLQLWKPVCIAREELMAD